MSVEIVAPLSHGGSSSSSVCRPHCPYMLRCFHSSAVTRSFIDKMSGKRLLTLTLRREMFGRHQAMNEMLDLGNFDLR